MTPQLWTRNLSWPEWIKMHPNLESREAEYLYNVELKMFQNYQDEILNQTRIRQARLSGDLMNLSADISSILVEGIGGGEETNFLLQEDSSFILQENGDKIVL